MFTFRKERHQNILIFLKKNSNSKFTKIIYSVWWAKLDSFSINFIIVASKLTKLIFRKSISSNWRSCYAIINAFLSCNKITFKNNDISWILFAWINWKAKLIKKRANQIVGSKGKKRKSVSYWEMPNTGSWTMKLAPFEIRHCTFIKRDWKSHAN